MLKKSKLILILILYVVIQAASLLIIFPFFVLSLVIYLVAIIFGAKDLYLKVNKNVGFKFLLQPFIFFLIANSALFIFYIPTLLMNGIEPQGKPWTQEATHKTHPGASPGEFLRLNGLKDYTE